MIAIVRKRTELEVNDTDRGISISQALKVNQKWKMVDKGSYVILSREVLKLKLNKHLFFEYFDIEED